MLTYKFNNTEQLVKFITAMPEFLTWETMICRFSTTNGLNIDMNTSIVDTSGKSNFIELQFLLPTINNFYQTIVASNYAELNVEIKLRLPLIFKNKYDPDNEYEGFYKFNSFFQVSRPTIPSQDNFLRFGNFSQMILYLYQIYHQPHQKDILMILIFPVKVLLYYLVHLF